MLSKQRGNGFQQDSDCLANKEATKWKMVHGRDMRSICENLVVLSYCLIRPIHLRRACPNVVGTPF